MQRNKKKTLQEVMKIYIEFKLAKKKFKQINTR